MDDPKAIREALAHATVDRTRYKAEWPDYVDQLLEDYHAALTRVDAADLERLYRAPAASCAPFVAHHDVGAEWLVP